MKANAPEKIYIHPDIGGREFFRHWLHRPASNESVEYIRADAFIEKALKWYCLDCECNDNCKDTKCFFYREYERYLKGEANAIPPKFSDRIINEDGSTSDNWRYRHFIKRMQDAFIEKACEFLDGIIYDYIELKHANVDTFMDVDNKRFIEDFKNHMKGE